MQWGWQTGECGWYSKFAWYPVRDINRRWCWLEWVDVIHYLSPAITVDQYRNTSGLSVAYRAREHSHT